jgi:putative flippase GtrA
MRKLLLQFTRFGLVGGVGFVVNLAIFNLLIFTVFEQSRVHEGPLFANVIATTVAIVVNWIGNRFWTFREHRGRQLAREGVEFAIVSLGGLVIGLGCLWISHYLLGFDSKLADNISSNVIGLGLGTAFRFSLYRLWVFSPRRGEPKPALFPDVESSEDVTEAPTPARRQDPARPSRRPARPGTATAPAAAVPQSD